MSGDSADKFIITPSGIVGESTAVQSGGNNQFQIRYWRRHLNGAVG